MGSEPTARMASESFAAFTAGCCHHRGTLRQREGLQRTLLSQIVSDCSEIRPEKKYRDDPITKDFSDIGCRITC